MVKTVERKKKNQASTTKRKAPSKSAKKRPTKSRSPARRTSKWKIIQWLFLLGLVLGAVLIVYCLYLNAWVTREFEGKRFSLPARVYARPLELFEGAELDMQAVQQELARLRYQAVQTTDVAGLYRRANNQLEIYVRAFNFWDERQPAQRIRVRFAAGRISEVENIDRQVVLPLVRLDPQVIGGIFPNGGEDRELVRINQVPRPLVNALVAVEDKRFFEHHGVDPKAVMRAFSSIVMNDRVQGGSTITQQLIKNFFLTRERTVTRKFNEMLMAMILEYHYSKAEILETYINEVFLGQDGDRAVHGFALGSQFYFAKSLEHIELQEAALLVGMLKGPVYYNPRRHPERAKERRDLVLREMKKQGIVTDAQYITAVNKSLGVTPKPNKGQSLYPSFMQLVMRQLQQDYREQDLRSEGLKIFTSLDPHIQNLAQEAMHKRLRELESGYGLSDNFLQGALVIADVNSGEVNAVVGDRKAGYKGFNRALDASRPIGSLIKPAMYLTAFTQGYELTSVLDDSPFVWQEAGIEDWKPKNYDGKFHGDVALWRAFANSYNVAAARLGTEVGVPNVMHTVQRLGVHKSLPEYASGLLGTVELTPFEVAQMYGTFASGGFKTPFRAIRDVTTKDGQPLNRYDVRVEPVVDTTANYLTVVAMQQVVAQGTARGLSRFVSPDVHVAGKTGTTDALRDSWFAGFSGDRLAVAWIGNDENKSIKLTGSSGALTLWGAAMSQLPLKPLQPGMPNGLVSLPVEKQTGFIDVRRCDGEFKLPHRQANLPQEALTCLNPREGKVKRWFKRLLGD